jgi:hypothetical protein
MHQNQMQLNKNKTKTIIHRSKNSDQFIVDSIETINSSKLLGVLIFDDLKWNNHIDTTCNKIIPYCTKTIKILNISALKSIYYSNRYFHLKYSIVSVGSSPHTNKNYFKYKNGLLDQY